MSELVWRSPEKAPKDGTQIVAEFHNYPFPIMAVWCGASDKWCGAAPHVDTYQGETNDWYFENEYFKESDLKQFAVLRDNE